MNLINETAYEIKFTDSNDLEIRKGEIVYIARSSGAEHLLMKNGDTLIFDFHYYHEDLLIIAIATLKAVLLNEVEWDLASYDWDSADITIEHIVLM